MGGNLINNSDLIDRSDLRSSVGKTHIPTVRMASRQEVPVEPPPEEELGRLKDAAQKEARCWKDQPRKKSQKFLDRHWPETVKRIRAALRRPPSRTAGGEATNGPLDELRNKFRLIGAALTGGADVLNLARNLPVVEIAENKNVVPRAYAAVSAYFRASRFAFQESAFVAFIMAIQEIYPLTLRELWALKGLSQLVLLEQIGRAVKAAEAADGEHLEQSLQIPVLVASLEALDFALWKEITEQVGVVERILREDPGGAYARMDAETRRRYLQEIYELGRYSDAEEPEIARRAIALARSAKSQSNINPRLREHRSHVGFYLVGDGRVLLERQIHYRPPISEWLRRVILAAPDIYYLVGIELLTFAIIAFLVIGARAPVSLVVALILLFLPAAEAAWGAMNQITVSFLRPRTLPRLDFSEGIPRECATLVVVPTLLLNEAYVRRMVAELEIRFLGNRDSHLYFALLTDAPDSPHPFDQSEGLVLLCSNLIQELNRKYSQQGGVSPFFLCHRFRTFNPSEGSWMGWERKRGKLLDLNDLLRDEKDSFPIKVGDFSLLPQIKYVIVVDSDTQLPRGVARRLVATLAHPLNRAVINPRINTVVQGYGILQPRVGISVQSASRSLLASIYSGQTGFDVYTRAVSDIYQDLFGEGSFAGKGIYEVDVFRQVLKNRFPGNAILSHDLIEGSYTRAGLVSDVEVIDDYPTRFSAYSRRKHRWVRGDWQIMLWLLPRVRNALGKKVTNPLSLVSRWKIFDNLRRSLVEIATFALLFSRLALPARKPAPLDADGRGAAIDTCLSPVDSGASQNPGWREPGC